jgi:hypothetical protein
LGKAEAEAGYVGPCPRLSNDLQSSAVLETADMSNLPSIELIAREAFETGMEILQIIDLMERQNTGRINGNISDSGAARAGITIRNSLTTRLVILVAGAFAITRPGDKHLRKGFQEMNDPRLRSQLAMNQIAFADAGAMFQRLQNDPRMATVKHFRYKSAAHSAIPAPGTRPPQYGEMFSFAKDVAATMEKFAIGVGVATETLVDTEDVRIESSQKFWEPWELLRS